jgi:hypothetical protein
VAMQRTRARLIHHQGLTLGYTCLGESIFFWCLPKTFVCSPTIFPTS